MNSALIVAGLVSLVTVLLYLDARAAQRAANAALAALRRQIAAHEEQLVTIGRALAHLAPPDARPTTPHPAAAADRGRARLAETRRDPVAPTAATARRIEGLALPSVDTEGDRAGIEPPESGDSPASLVARLDAARGELGTRPGDEGPTDEEIVAELRAHHEREADQRDAARAKRERQVPATVIDRWQAVGIVTREEADRLRARAAAEGAEILARFQAAADAREEAGEDGLADDLTQVYGSHERPRPANAAERTRFSSHLTRSPAATMLSMPALAQPSPRPVPAVFVESRAGGDGDDERG